jgi:hypothetical protein
VSAPGGIAWGVFFTTGLIWFCLFLYITTCALSGLGIGASLWLRGEASRLEAELHR